MSNYSIGLSGLDAAQRALDVIGNNIANAATEGYHRQRVNLSPAFSTQEGDVLFGGGVNIKSVTRMIDDLLEKEILRQQSSLEQLSQEFTTLRTVENTFGEFSTDSGGLNAAIDKFFNALQDLSAHPSEIIWQDQAVSEAKAMAGQFRTLAESLTKLETQIGLEADNIVESVNTLTSQIAELNYNIQRREITGARANNLRDQRDQSITELAKLVGIQTQIREYGIVDVSIAGLPVVMTAQSNDLEAGLDENGNLAISIVGASNYTTDIEGGKIGAFLLLKNDTLSDIHTKLDLLAGAIIEQINQYHVQGVGSEGSFSQLTGWTNTSGDLSDFSTVSAGYVYIRVTNTSTDAITRTAIPVLQDASSDTLTEIAAYITANVANVSASVNSSNQLTITAGTGYEFDFLPAVLPAPETGDIDFNGTTDPSVSLSGIYSGNSNDTLLFTVSGTGDVGVDTPLILTVTDIALNTIDTINIGSGYAAGETINVGNTGIKIALSMGDLVAADSFSIDVFADSDTSGLLSAAGINTFFSGYNASDIAVNSALSTTPGLVATASGGDKTDNVNVLRMAAVKNQAVTSLGSLTCGQYYRRLVTDIGQELSLKQVRQENAEIMMQNLATQQSEISGVNINDEAAALLIFEQMFQAMAKYLSTVQASIDTLMGLI